MDSLKLKISIVTPERTVFEGEAYQATLPILDGEIAILPKHRSYIGALKAGEIILKDEGGKELADMAVSGGFIEFSNDTNNLVILADTAERAEEIDLERAEEARKKAEELKSQTVFMDETDYARILVAIDKNWARIKVARKSYSRRGMNLNNN